MTDPTAGDFMAPSTARVVDPVLISPEVAVLWRLAGEYQPGEPPPAGDPGFSCMRPRVLCLMVELLINELEQEPPETPPSAEDLIVLLRSANTRVRMLGVRLNTTRQT